MTRHGINLDSEAVHSFCRKWKISELSVFGSVLGNEFGPKSDLDFVVEFEANSDWDLSDIADMSEDLSRILGREVDVITQYALKTSPNWLLRKRILSSMETVYASR